MRINEWVFYNTMHPVYQRPQGADRWLDPLPGMVPESYKGGTAGPVSEPLSMSMAGFPSVDIHQAGSGATVQQVTLRGPYAAEADLAEINDVANRWLGALEGLSHGPYSQHDLADMGHPYGYGEPRQGRTPAEPPSWERLNRPRRIPAMRSAAYTKGLRGRVANRSVVNEQSGAFAAAWSKRILRWFGGVTLLFINSAPYSWFLAHGTIFMQAHGPWESVARRLTPRMHAAWFNAEREAWQQREQAMRHTEADQGQFGTEPLLEQTAAAEAGGWA